VGAKQVADGQDSSAESASEPTTAAKPTAKPKPKAGGKSGSDLSASSAPEAPKRLSVTTQTAVDDETATGSSTQRADALDVSVGQASESSRRQVPVQISAPPTALTARTASDQAVQALASAPAAANSAVSAWNSVLSVVGLVPSADGDVPQVPGDSPLELAGLAAFRRQTQQASTEDATLTKTVDQPQQSSLTLLSADSSQAQPMRTAATAVNSPPDARDDAYSTAANTTLTVTSANSALKNDTDANGDKLRVISNTTPAQGTLTMSSTGQFTYVPKANFVGTDSFNYTISDGKGGTDTATVTITVTAVNKPPDAINDAYTVAEDSVLTVTSTNSVLKNDVDPNGDPLTVTSKTAPAHGTLTMNSIGQFTYTPNANFNGTDSFNYTVSDGKGGTDTATVTITVTPVNDAPVAVGDPTVGTANLTDGAISGLVNLKDPDGDPLTYVTASGPSNGSVVFDAAAGTYTYTPTPAARQQAAQSPGLTDTFTIRGTDPYGASVTTASITVSISPTAVPNRAPQAGTPSIDTRDVATGAISGSLNFTDPDNNPMTYSVPTQPSSGTVTLVGSRYTFTPYQSARDAAALSEGPDAVDITVVASDGQLSTPVTFSVPILPPSTNQAPVHGTPSADTIVNSSGAVSGSLNFTDPDGDPMTYSVPTQPSSGTVTLSGSTYTFTPTAAARAAAAGSHGVDLATITVVASDGQASDSVTFTVPIMQSAKTTNQAPWVPGSTIPRTVDPVSGTVTGYVNVQDADGDTLIYTLASPPTQGGTVTFDQRSGYFTYTPSQAARAQAAQTPGLDYDTFSVNVTDGTATVSTTVKVQVAAALPPTSPTTSNTVNVGSGPSGVVVLSNNNAYVVNYDSNTVTVINTTTNQVVKTIDVGSGPLSVTAVDTTQRQRVYVANSLSNTVTVIDPTTNTVVDTITVPVQEGSYYDGYYDYTFTYPNQVDKVAASGNRLYVNATDGTISVFDTTNDGNTLLRTDSLGVYNDLELSADGTRLFGTNGGGLTVINTATMSPTKVPIGPVFTPEGSYQEYTSSVGNVALSPDGKRAYVTYGVTIAQRGVGGQPYGSFFTDSTGSNWMITGGYSAVSVIDTDPTSATYNKEIARILVPLGGGDLVVSGNNLYVLNSDNMTLTVIDRTTNTLVGMFSTDQSTAGRAPIEVFPGFWAGYVPASARYIAVDKNGAVYITDYADGKMYAVTVGSPAV
jgi:YVTN family beta-propeller protein/VCBS repeat-containing protein